VSDALDAFYQIPPDRVQVRPVGIAVQLALEVHHHQHPSRRHQHSRAQLAADFRGLGGGHVGAHHLVQPRRLARQPAEVHRHALGRQDVRGLAQHVRQ
jgi:hypothetical protein